MTKKRIQLALTIPFITLITACGSVADSVKSEKALEQTVHVVSTDKSHISRKITKVVDTEHSSSSHIYSADTKVIRASEHSKGVAVNSELIGRWKGGISMGDHEHPLTIEITEDIDGGLSASYTYFGMDTRGMSEVNRKDKSLDYKNGDITFFLPDAGVRFVGSVSSSTLIEGAVEWMGLKQPLQIKKITPDKKKQKFNHTHAQDKKLNIAILLFDGIDVLDWAGPLEVFVNAHAFNTFTVAHTMRAYDGGSYQVTPEYTFANMPKADILIVPGGGVAPLFHQTEVMDWIKITSEQAQITMSVCNAANLLAGASLLDGLEATTHGSWMHWLGRQATQLNFTAVDDQRFVDNGKIITTAGVSSGIDGALHVVARLKGLAHARMAARMIEYNWQPSNIKQYK